MNLSHVFLFLFSNSFHFIFCQMNLNLEVIQKWADDFGHAIYDMSSRTTALLDIKTDYVLMDPEVKKVDGTVLVAEIKEKLEKLLGKKVQAVKNLVEVAENAFIHHVYDKEIKLNYYNSKDLNFSEFELIEVDHFKSIPVNLTYSTIHVPTNVYNESVVILNGVAWSDALNTAFITNYKDDITPTWQYFCSATGFLRTYPGAEWKTGNDREVDTFDCRVRDWYLQAAATPKDLVILLDRSGSMKGLRIQIAKATVDKILDTLNDDDFFNIIKYSDSPEFIDPCFNGTFIQATDSNKIEAKNALLTVTTKGMAHLDQALIEAFELFSISHIGAKCNKAIMIVTDGAVENYKHIFDKYQRNRMDVRVFTFLIGREVGDTKEVRWMACENKGRFSHITSLADVHEHVQEYIHVISRPMIIARKYHYSWTNVYSDTHKPGLNMITTISQPVFDLRSETEKMGVLLGVMGTDVPLKEIEKLIPPYKVGVNGYSFAITSNGYALFHPRLKPRQPNLDDYNGAYNAVDLFDLEPLDYEKMIRTQMIKRETGFQKLKSFIVYEEQNGPHQKRAKIRESTYFYTYIKDTPFSVGIALPEDYGQYFVDGTRKPSQADISSLGSNDIILAPWNYCVGLDSDTRIGRLGSLIKIINEHRRTNASIGTKCDKELLESLLFDAEATRGATAGWVKENHDSLGSDPKNKDGVELVFIGTKGGLTRYMTLSPSLTDPIFLKNHTRTIEELYYKRAADNGETVFTFSVPINKERNNMKDCVLTASTPISIHDGDKMAVAAVVGFQMKYSYFYDMFMSVAGTIPLPASMNDGGSHSGINYTCRDPDLNCYLLDEHGYVVFSENPYDVGMFFGMVDGMAAFLDEVVIDDFGSSEKADQATRFLRKQLIIDNQATCNEYGSYGSSSSLVLPAQMGTILSYTTWLLGILQEILISALQFNLSTLWSSLAQAFEEVTTKATDSTGEYEHYYEGMDTQNPRLQPDMMECAAFENEDKEKLKKCLKDLRSKYSPKVTGQRTCTHINTYYIAQYIELPVSGSITRCDGSCSNSFSVNHVANTNLMLFVTDNSCRCKNERSISDEPKEVDYNQSFVCHKLQSDVFRERPVQCFAYHEMENYTECGTSNSKQASVYLLVFSLFFVS